MDDRADGGIHSGRSLVLVMFEKQKHTPSVESESKNARQGIKTIACFIQILFHLV